MAYVHIQMIPETEAIIQLRNIKFKEGLGHYTLMPEGEYFKDNNNSLNLGFLDKTTVSPAEETTLPSFNQTPDPVLTTIQLTP
jgi:hypothetical protein